MVGLDANEACVPALIDRKLIICRTSGGGGGNRRDPMIRIRSSR